MRIEDITDNGKSCSIVLENGMIRCDIENETCGSCFISNLCVDFNHRKNGLGNKLLTMAEQYAIENSCESVCLLVDVGSWMQDWYVKCGYKKVIIWESGRVLMNKNLQ